MYATPRATVEASNAYLKDHGRGALDQPGRRRMRGQTAQHLLVTMVVVAANISKIITFLAQRDGDEPVRRSRRKRRRFGWDFANAPSGPLTPNVLE